MDYYYIKKEFKEKKKNNKDLKVLKKIYNNPY